MKRSAPLLVLAVMALGACDVPTPLAPAEPIGEVPTWGEGFALPAEQPSSMLGNTELPSGTQSPGDTGSWSGGDAALGKITWDQKCASCHGANGEGGTGPALAAAKWQESVEDRQIARTVALGKGTMPSFMRDLDKPKLQGLVAHIRSMKRQ